MRYLPLVLLLALCGCKLFPVTTGTPRYVLERPYQSDGVWRYPREDFAYTDTGLATVYDGSGRTADGEGFDATALAAAHPTLQLPALARVTNLENGRQVLVRINDRGPASAARLLGITRRTAELLGAPGATALRVKVQVQEAESRAMAADLREEGPALTVAAAPSGAVQKESLAPPTGAVQAARVQTAAARPAPVASNAGAPPGNVPLRLPPEVWLTTPRPGVLAIECGALSRPEYANVLRNRLAAYGAQVVTDYNAPRDRAYMVRLGPFASVEAAEATLRRVLTTVPDARIIVQ